MPAWLPGALALIDGRDPHIPTVEKVARSIGVHRNTLSRTFKAYQGIRLSEYRRWLRARRARDGLLGSNLPLADVAMSFGYTDQSHMTRELACLFGVTPGSLRQLNALARAVPQHPLPA